MKPLLETQVVFHEDRPGCRQMAPGRFSLLPRPFSPPGMTLSPDVSRLLPRQGTTRSHGRGSGGDDREGPAASKTSWTERRLDSIIFVEPKLSDSVDAHRVPLGSAVRMGRRNLFAGHRNGSRAAQILTKSPGRQCPTTETAVAACEEVLETPGALSKPGCILRRPMRTADPSGPFRKNQN